MWKIVWTQQAENSYLSNLEYWINHNKSTVYSEEIMYRVESVLKKLSTNPTSLVRYNKDLNLYQKVFFKNKFSLFYEINLEDKLITIKHFRNNRQEPLGDS